MEVAVRPREIDPGRDRVTTRCTAPHPARCFLLSLTAFAVVAVVAWALVRVV